MYRLLFSTAMLWTGLFGQLAIGQSPSFDSAGVPIRYESMGEGTPVLLIHGFAVNGRTNWGVSGVVDRLSKSHRVILMDVRGHGRSGKPHDESQYGLELVNDVSRLLDHLNLDKAHIAGYSMGGLITMKFAIEQPQRILSASVCAAAWLRPDQEEAPVFIEQVAKSLESGNGPLPLLQRLNPSTDPINLARITSTNNFLKTVNDCQALAAAFRSFPKLSITQSEMENCRVPVQFIVGTHDPAPTSLDRLKQLSNSNFKITEIRGANHVTTMISTELCDGLNEFILQNDSPSQLEPSSPTER